MIKPGLSSKLRRKRAGQPGKCNIVRLYGKALAALRLQCFERDGYRCQECARPAMWATGEMAHIRNKRMYGDVIENVRVLCRDCHRDEHAGRIPRPLDR